MKVNIFELSFDGETTTFVSDHGKSFGEDHHLRTAITRLVNDLQIPNSPSLNDFTIEQMLNELTARLT